MEHSIYTNESVPRHFINDMLAIEYLNIVSLMVGQKIHQSFGLAERNLLSKLQQLVLVLKIEYFCVYYRVKAFESVLKPS